MDKEIKQEARKQYLHYFRIWFLVIGILLVVFLVVSVVHALSDTGTGRKNTQAPTERVYDYANVLTDNEEQNLREYIAECEAKYEIDLVLVTINEDVERHGYWDTVMMNMADDFYDEKGYGYNKVHGDGALLLDNWYKDEHGSQAGSWLSTCGIVHDRLGDYEIDMVLDEVYYQVEDNPYAAYKAYVKATCEYASGTIIASIPWWFILLGPAVIAVIYALTNLVQKKANDTTTAKTYVEGGKCVVTASSDNFLRKNVVSRRIETNSSSGGHSSGSGGSHRSSSGVRHGGGGRRR